MEKHSKLYACKTQKHLDNLDRHMLGWESELGMFVLVRQLDGWLIEKMNIP